MKNYFLTIILSKHNIVKSCILLCLLLLSSNGIVAQNTKQSFGLRVSVGLSSFLDKHSPSRYKPRGLSYDLSLFTHVRRTNRAIGLNIEANYSQKNITYGSFDYALNYFSLGLIPGYHLDKSGTVIYLGGNASLLSTYTITNGNSRSSSLDLSSYDLHLITGFSQKLFTINQVKIDLDTRFNIGFSIKGPETRNYGVSVGILIKKNVKKTD